MGTWNKNRGSKSASMCGSCGKGEFSMAGAHICEKKPECTTADVLTTNADISTCKKGADGVYTRATAATMNQIAGTDEKMCSYFDVLLLLLYLYAHTVTSRFSTFDLCTALLHHLCLQVRSPKTCLG